jgi:hypothetical protein
LAPLDQPLSLGVTNCRTDPDETLDTEDVQKPTNAT